MKKLRDLNKTDRLFLIIAVIIPLICFIPLLIDRVNNRHFNSYTAGETLIIKNNGNDVIPIETITQNDVLEQSFRCNCYSIVSIIIYFDKDSTVNSGKLHIDLIDEQDAVLESWDIDTSGIGGDGSIKLDIANSSRKQGMIDKIYRLRIYAPDPDSDFKSSLCVTADDIYEEGSLYVNDSDTGVDLIMTIGGINNIMSYDHVRVWLSIYLIIGFELLLMYIRKVYIRRRLVV